ncbi:MAG: chemotaxis protein CheR [Alphaproteobacteria bacterium RIFOXYD12_FULL_60_8]|nr:MAG: chemotaxis protein CheR [Alphaproteobacteria bacterium RIFOXYD12_FULL_60_8]
MTPEDVALFSQIVKERSGLILTPEKAYLLESRLLPIARKQGLATLEDLARQIRHAKTEALLESITEALTTNETFFFRDTKPFDLLKDLVLPPLIESRASSRTLRIWCAAASSGQEPYSIAMILKEMSAKLAGWTIKIVATDISKEILDKAKAGRYSQFEVQRGLPITFLVKYFKKDGDSWALSEDIKKMVDFRFFNLLDNVTSLGTYDVVFCRNVLIYFDRETKARILNQTSTMMPADGTLFLGGAETVLGITDQFKPVAGQRGIYARA